MHALPGIVDGARKTSQVGKWVQGGAPGKSGRFSSLPMLEATSSRDQRMSAGSRGTTHYERVVTGTPVKGTGGNQYRYRSVQPVVLA